ncbi:hypothetical protein WA556_003692 [Blastocystis sp. ATCC 50177/Nand II]
MNYQHPERCVFIGNIPYKASEDDVRPILQSVGTIVNLDLKRDPTTGLCTGIGFCEFADEETAELAKRMNNKKSIKGRLLRIDNPDGGKKGVVAATSKSAIDGLTQEECYRLLVNMQNLVKTDPTKAKTLMTENPSIVNAVDELLQLNHLK